MLALGQFTNCDLLALVALFEPPDGDAIECVEIVLHDDHAAGLLGQAHNVAALDAGASDIDALAVDQDLAVAYELTSLRTGLGPACAVHHVVEALLKQTQQVLTGWALQTVGLFVGAAELTLEHTVDELGLLLFLQLSEVFAAGIATAGTAVLARWERTTLKRLATLFVLEDVGR